MDNAFEWEPTFKQERFLSVPLTVKEAFYAGAVNAGKSDVLIMYPIVHGWHEHPQFKGVFARRTNSELELEVLPRAIEYLRHHGGVWKEGKGRFEFPSGALYFFRHLEHEKNVHDFDSMQPNYFAFDELTSFTEWQYLYITIERVRRNLKVKNELPAIVRSASNPGNIGHAWVYKRFIKPNPLGGTILKGKGGIKRIYIPATIDDNPYADPVYKAELDALPEAERKAKKLGDWTAFEGTVFNEFRKIHHPGEPENALHKINEFDVPSYWPKICAIDWGFRAMTYVCYGAISPKGRLYCYREQSFTGENIEIWGPKVKYYLDKENPQDIVICHSANQHRGEPHTILELVSDALNRTIRLGERDRLSGKTLLHEYLRWKPKLFPMDEIPIYDEVLASWIMRNKGLEDYKTYMRSLTPPQHDETLPKFQIMENCPLLIEAISVAQYEAIKGSNKPPEDVAEWNGDDPYDCVRMLLHAADRYFIESSEIADRMNKEEIIVQQLSSTNDMTAYYRNMRKLESDNESSDAPVGRFHHRVH